MTHTLIFATHNNNKLNEVNHTFHLLDPSLLNKINILSLDQIGCHNDIPEPADTLEDNARIKARYIAARYNTNCFADDTGLEVNCLNGAPGVMSARYAGGEGHNAQANMEKLLKEMEQQNDRRARFRTVIALIYNGKEHIVEGTIEGTITRQPYGTAGFGYDPLFIPNGYTQTFAQLGDEIKNKISHRAQAVKALCTLLKQCIQ